MAKVTHFAPIKGNFFCDRPGRRFDGGYAVVNELFFYTDKMKRCWPNFKVLT